MFPTACIHSGSRAVPAFLSTRRVQRSDNIGVFPPPSSCLPSPRPPRPPRDNFFLQPSPVEVQIQRAGDGKYYPKKGETVAVHYSIKVRARPHSQYTHAEICTCYRALYTPRQPDSQTDSHDVNVVVSFRFQHLFQQRPGPKIVVGHFVSFRAVGSVPFKFAKFVHPFFTHSSVFFIVTPFHPCVCIIPPPKN